METTQSLMKQAAETIEILGEELQRARDLATESMQELTQELDRARALAVKLEGAGLYLTEDEVLALARKLDGKPVQSETEDIALLTATNTIQARAQDIVYAQMSRRRQEDGKDD
jgi:O-methyltransferase involved in polyketide biosynthesis